MILEILGKVIFYFLWALIVFGYCIFMQELFHFKTFRNKWLNTVSFVICFVYLMIFLSGFNK